MNSKYNMIIKYHIQAICAAPLHIGDSDGIDGEILIDTIENKPYIQGSSIAGAINEYIVQQYGERFADRIMGSSLTNTKSPVSVSDAYFDDKTLKCEYRTQIRIDAKTGTVASNNKQGTDSESGQLFNTEYVSRGSEFEFDIYIFSKSDAEEYEECMESVLHAINEGIIMFGAKKSNGCGRIALKSVKRCRFNLLEKRGRKKWAEEDSKLGTEIIDDISKKTVDSSGYRLSANLKFPDGILIKSGNIRLSGGKTEAVGMTDANGNHIIPGSTIKGVIRNRASLIAESLNLREDVISVMFGRENEKNDDGMQKPGIVRFHECLIENELGQAEERKVIRIKINKFSGGVYGHSLINERPVGGNTALVIDIADRYICDSSADIDYEKAACAIMMFVIRDIAIHRFNIGSEFSIGRGITDVDVLNISDSSGNELLASDLRTDMSGTFVAECLGELRKLRDN